MACCMHPLFLWILWRRISVVCLLFTHRICLFFLFLFLFFLGGGGGRGEGRHREGKGKEEKWHYWKQFHKGLGAISSPYSSILGCQVPAAACWGWADTPAIRSTSSPAEQPEACIFLCSIMCVYTRPWKPDQREGLQLGRKSRESAMLKALVRASLNPGCYLWFTLTSDPSTFNESAILNRF